MDTEAFRTWLLSKGPKSAHVRSDIVSRCRRAERFYFIDLDTIKTIAGAQQLDLDIYLNVGNIFHRVKDVIRARNHMRYALNYYWGFRKITFEPAMKYNRDTSAIKGIKGQSKPTTRQRRAR